jgi:acyl-CoA thioester hydrolase
MTGSGGGNGGSSDARMAEPWRRQLDSYPFTHEVQARYGDLDPFGHLNNVAIAQAYEEARASLSYRLFGADVMHGRSPNTVVIPTVVLHYYVPVLWPGRIQVGAGVAEIGRTSFRCGYGLFSDGECVGVSDAVLVLLRDRRPEPLPPQIRAQLEQLRLSGAASDVPDPAAERAR